MLAWQFKLGYYDNLTQCWLVLDECLLDASAFKLPSGVNQRLQSACTCLYELFTQDFVAKQVAKLQLNIIIHC